MKFIEKPLHYLLILTTNNFSESFDVLKSKFYPAHTKLFKLVRSPVIYIVCTRYAT